MRILIIMLSFCSFLQVFAQSQEELALRFGKQLLQVLQTEDYAVIDTLLVPNAIYLETMNWPRERSSRQVLSGLRKGHLAKHGKALYDLRNALKKKKFKWKKAELIEHFLEKKGETPFLFTLSLVFQDRKSTYKLILEPVLLTKTGLFMDWDCHTQAEKILP